MQYTFKVKELKCPDCASLLATNLQKIEYIKEVNINYDRKKISIEGRRNLTEDEVKMILSTVVNLSKCPFHQNGKVVASKKQKHHEHKHEHAHCDCCEHEHNHEHDEKCNNCTKYENANSENKELGPNMAIDEYMFENIDCPNCALKVERALNKCNDIIDAKVNFVNKKIIITHRNNVEVYETVCKEVKKIESEAVVLKNKTEKTKKSKVSLILFIVSVALFIAASLYWIIGKDENFYMYIIFGVIYFLIGYKVLYESFKNIIHGQIFDENFLMLIASVGAFINREPIEAIMVILLYRIGEKIQSRAIDKSTKSIQGLMELKVDKATLESGEVVELKDVHVGDIIVVKVGEKVPLDGVVIDGNTTLDTKCLTGESLPSEINIGDEVLSGCINLTKVIKVRVTAVESDSTISKVVKLIDEASNKKSKTEKFITKFARIYTPIVLVAAVVTGLVMKFALNISNDETINTVLVFLTVSCPCALVISVPLGFFSGIGRASSEGILVKGGNYLEYLSKTKSFVFDKTGTLSEGNFVVDEINVFGGYTYDKLLEITATIESFSNHPIAKSVVTAYHGDINQDRVTDLQELAGFGLAANFEGKKVLIGNERLMKENKIDYVLETCPGSVVYIAIDGEFVGSIVVIDELKPRAKETIEYLRSQSINTTILSGDSETIVNSVKKKLGVDEAYAKLLPNEKLDILSDKLKQNKSIVYVGDGINDTPSLKMATVGIAMGAKGSDIAKTAADVVIMNDDIGKVIDAIAISKKTMRIIYENIIIAILIKVGVLVLSTLQLLGSYGMLIGVLSDVGLCLLAILNTLRIIKKTKKY